MNKNKGFTLVELLAVIVVLAIIIIISIPAITGIANSARKQSFYLYAQSVNQKALNKYVSQLSNRNNINDECAIYRIDSNDLDIPNTDEYQGWIMVKRLPASSGSYKYTLTLDTGNENKKLFEVRYCTVEGTSCDPYEAMSNNTYFSDYYDSHENSRVVLEKTLPNNNYALCATYDYVDDTGHMKKKDTICSSNKELVTDDTYEYEVTLSMRNRKYAVENVLMQQDNENNNNTTFKELFYSYMDGYARSNASRLDLMPLRELTCDGTPGDLISYSGERLSTKEVTTTTTTIIQHITEWTEPIHITTIEPETTVEKVDTSLLLDYLNITGYDIGFSPTQTSYHIGVPYTVANLNVSAKAKDPSAKVEITGGDSLSVGNNIIRVFVHTGENESYKEINYYIYVNRMANPSLDGGNGQVRITTKVEETTVNGLPDPTLPESNCLLTNLMVSGYDFTDPFTAKTFEYDIEIPKSTNKLAISTIPQNTNSSITVTGNENLTDGSEIIVNVVSSNGYYKSTYKIKVHTYDDTDVGKLVLRLITGVLIIVLVILGVIITKQKREEKIIRETNERNKLPRDVIRPTEIPQENVEQQVNTDNNNQGNV